MKSWVTIVPVLLSVVVLAGCGTLTGGALGAGLGAAGAAAVGAPPAVGAKLGAVIGGGAGAIYDLNRAANGQPVVWLPGQPHIVVADQPLTYRRPVMCIGGKLTEEYGNMSDPNGGPSYYVKTGRVFCDYPSGRRVIISQ